MQARPLMSRLYRRKDSSSLVIVSIVSGHLRGFAMGRTRQSSLQDRVAGGQEYVHCMVELYQSLVVERELYARQAVQDCATLVPNIVRLVRAKESVCVSLEQAHTASPVLVAK